MHSHCTKLLSILCTEKVSPMPNHVLCKLFICGLTYVAASRQGVQERVEANKQGGGLENQK